MRTILASAAEGRRTALLLALLGGSLTEPEDFVRELPGGHDWAAWRSLWSEFLSDGKAVLQ